MTALQEYDWPGNIRELENFIERSVILSTGSELAAPVNELISQSSENAQPEGGAALIEIQRMRIIEALRNSDGNMTRAASRLGLKRTTLQSKMKHAESTRMAAGSAQCNRHRFCPLFRPNLSQTPAAYLMGNAGAGRGS